MQRREGKPTGHQQVFAERQADIAERFGDVFASARVLLFVRCAPAASDPPRIAATSEPTAPPCASSAPTADAASSAPAGTRMNVCTVSQMLSTHGILSAKNSTMTMKPDAASTSGCDSRCSPSGIATQPARSTMPTMNSTRYSRMPLAHPSAAASATTCVGSRVFNMGRVRAARMRPRNARS